MINFCAYFFVKLFFRNYRFLQFILEILSRTRVLLVGLASSILFLDDFVAPIDDVPILPGLLAILCASLIISLVLKLSPVKEIVRVTLRSFQFTFF